jgi:alkaline phosphatase
MDHVELSDILIDDDVEEVSEGVDSQQGKGEPENVPAVPWILASGEQARAALATLVALLLVVLVLTIVLATSTASLDQCRDQIDVLSAVRPVPNVTPTPTAPLAPGTTSNVLPSTGAPAAPTAAPGPPATVGSIILLVSDGMGPATTGAIRVMEAVQQEREARGDGSPNWSSITAAVRNGSRIASLPLDELLVGSIRTYSSNSWVTDSAAGATSYACALKTYNGAIAVDPSARPCRTVLEALKEDRGFATGVVATSRLTHATPAAFAAHVRNRGDESSIAMGMTRPGLLDVALGGGASYLPPSLVASRRPNATFITTSTQLADATSTPLFGLFANGHLDYELDRDSAAQPSLTDMTAKALSLLQAKVDHGDVPGFFLLVEGSRIDHAGHRNDAAAHVAEAREYSRTVGAVLDHARAHPGTLVVGVSDHETGGMSLGRDGVYEWNPEILLQVHASADVAASKVRSAFRPTENATDADENAAFRAALAPYLSFSLSEQETTSLRSSVTSGQGGNAILNLVNTRARIGWTSGGHTGVDVPLHAFGGGDTFRGNLEDIEVGRRIAQLAGITLPQLL